MTAREDQKKIVGEYAAGFVNNHSTIGLGTGSTVYWFIQKLREKIKQGLQVSAVPTSIESENLAREAGIIMKDINEVDRLDLCIDGADEIDVHFELIKGGGGALLREKMIASLADNFYVIADESKLVNHLGKFPVPVEVVQFGWKQVMQQINALGCQLVKLRERAEQSFVTDNGNYILDCYFGEIYSPYELNLKLHMIPGVVETGLFINMVGKVIIAFSDGSIKEFDNYLINSDGSS